MNHEKMTAQELALVLNIHEETIRKLAKTEQIPYFQQKNRIYFIFFSLFNLFIFLF
jgi:Mg2+ and Co2+ transporter CorA